MDADALTLRGDALRLPLRDESVDLIVTSPPYFSLRSYRDGDDHYEGQIGSEPHPQQFLEALWAVTAECWRVLKPSGSMFVNLGDKRSGSGAPGTTSGLAGRRVGGTPIPGQVKVQGERSGIDGGYNQAAFGRAKSKMLLPHRYAIGCEDGAADPEGIGWVVRQDMVWEKPNGLPESTRDRVRDSHEYWFHLTRQGDYFTAMDEIREPQMMTGNPRTGSTSGRASGNGVRHRQFDSEPENFNPLGKIPNSVWRVPTEPLSVPDYLVEDAAGWRMLDSPEVWRYVEHRTHGGDWSPVRLTELDHYAAFPTEWPRRLILGWTPNGICLDCGAGRFPVVDKQQIPYRANGVQTGRPRRHVPGGSEGNGFNAKGYPQTNERVEIVGYACDCTPYEETVELAFGGTFANRTPAHDRQWGTGSPRRRRRYQFDSWTPPPTRPAVVLDPFGGTGTTAMVARALGRVGVSVDLSWDYCRLARWRVFRSGHGDKAARRTQAERQGTLAL